MTSLPSVKARLTCFYLACFVHRNEKFESNFNPGILGLFTFNMRLRDYESDNSSNIHIFTTAKYLNLSENTIKIKMKCNLQIKISQSKFYGFN